MAVADRPVDRLTAEHGAARAPRGQRPTRGAHNDMENTMKVHGVDGTVNVIDQNNGSGIVARQVWTSEARKAKGYPDALIRCQIRYDDQCKNGHNTFAITATVWDKKRGEPTATHDRGFITGGCCHEEIAAAFPELAHMILWHGMNSDGPRGYEQNVIYLAGERDCWGLLKGEERQIKNGRTGELAWILEGQPTKYHDGPTAPEGGYTATWKPWNRVGEGKTRQLDAARSAAHWPDATDEELSAPADELRAKLTQRLPALIQSFRQAMKDAGMIGA